VADLFELPDLANTLQADLDTASAAEARRKAQAWLSSATRLSEWPTPAPEDLRAWALELAVIAYDNPSGLSLETVNGTTQQWAVSRRAEILLEARQRYAAAVGGPMGVFPLPPSPSWPDPVTPGLGGRIYYR
jgi:hypothetical protein